MEHFINGSAPQNVTCGNTSTELVAANSGRGYLLLTNDSNEVIYLSFGQAAVANKGHRLNANGGLLEINGDAPFKGAIYGICASGGKNVCFIEG